MDDLISRQAAIEALTPTVKSIMEGNSFKGFIILEKLRELPSADIPKWIPCSERLPEEEINSEYGGCGWSDDVLTTIKRVDIDGTAYYDVKTNYYNYDSEEGEKGWAVVLDDEEIIAWMELPEPYQAEGRSDG